MVDASEKDRFLADMMMTDPCSEKKGKGKQTKFFDEVDEASEHIALDKGSNHEDYEILDDMDYEILDNEDTQLTAEQWNKVEENGYLAPRSRKLMEAMKRRLRHSIPSSLTGSSLTVCCMWST